MGAAGAAPPSAGGFDLDSALFPYSILVARLHPIKPGSKTPDSFIPWPLRATKAPGRCWPGHPGSRAPSPGGWRAEGGLVPCVAPGTEQQPPPAYPSTASPGEERVILGLIEPELIEFTFPTEREELPYDNEAGARS